MLFPMLAPSTVIRPCSNSGLSGPTDRQGVRLLGCRRQACPGVPETLRIEAAGDHCRDRRPKFNLGKLRA